MLAGLPSLLGQGYLYQVGQQFFTDVRAQPGLLPAQPEDQGCSRNPLAFRGIHLMDSAVTGLLGS